jgi:RNA polymerase sigma-70 factor (ECF subfamily)
MDVQADLLKQAQNLDPQALALIHNQYYDAIYRMVLYRVGDVPQAEDLTGEVFTRLLEALHAGRAPQESIRGWLFQVANNVVSDHFRRAYRREQVALSEALPADDTGQTSQLIKKLRTEKLHQAMGMLAEDQAAVLAYRFGAGMSIREVAGLLERSEGAVKMLQARAVKTLARILEAPA